MNHFITTRLRHGLLAAALLATAGGAFAQATIDHNKALAGNVTPGDAPGYPVTISRPGHYKLMGNLTVPAATMAIHITAANVTLDLNGFTVAGQGTCSRNADTRTVTCWGVNAQLHGIKVGGGDGATPNAVIRNGRVMGFGFGVVLDDYATVHDMTFMHNVISGLSAASRVSVARVHASLNGTNGMTVMSGSISDSVAADNGMYGIHSLSNDGKAATLVINSVAIGNRLTGINNATVRGTLQGDNGAIHRTQVRSAGSNADANGIY